MNQKEQMSEAMVNTVLDNAAKLANRGEEESRKRYQDVLKKREELAPEPPTSTDVQIVNTEEEGLRPDSLEYTKERQYEDPSNGKRTPDDAVGDTVVGGALGVAKAVQNMSGLGAFAGAKIQEMRQKAMGIPEEERINVGKVVEYVYDDILEAGSVNSALENEYSDKYKNKLGKMQKMLDGLEGKPWHEQIPEVLSFYGENIGVIPTQLAEIIPQSIIEAGGYGKLVAGFARAGGAGALRTSTKSMAGAGLSGASAYVANAYQQGGAEGLNRSGVGIEAGTVGLGTAAITRLGGNLRGYNMDSIGLGGQAANSQRGIIAAGRNVLQGGRNEFIEETLQNPLQNMVYNHATGEPVFKDVGTDLAVGGVLGGAAGATTAIPSSVAMALRGAKDSATNVKGKAVDAYKNYRGGSIEQNLDLDDPKSNPERAYKLATQMASSKDSEEKAKGIEYLKLVNNTVKTREAEIMQRLGEATAVEDKATIQEELDLFRKEKVNPLRAAIKADIKASTAGADRALKLAGEVSTSIQEKTGKTLQEIQESARQKIGSYTPITATTPGSGVTTSTPKKQGVPLNQVIPKPDNAARSIIASLVGTESSGVVSAEYTNKDGRKFGGLIQMGDARLKDYANATKTKAIKAADFKNLSAEQQTKINEWHINDLITQANKTGAIGKEINGTEVTLGGLVAMAHLGGVSGMKEFVRTNGTSDPQDDLGTKLSDYLAKHANSEDFNSKRIQDLYNATNAETTPLMVSVGAPAAPKYNFASPIDSSKAIEYRNNNSGTKRNEKLSSDLESTIKEVLAPMGIRFAVHSGGQSATSNGTAGGPRHNDGNAADGDFYIGDRKLDWSKPEDLKIFEAIVEELAANGVTGIGGDKDYMGTGRLHIGFGGDATWGGKGGKGAAPKWMQDAQKRGLERPKSTNVANVAAPISEEAETQESTISFDEEYEATLAEIDQLLEEHGSTEEEKQEVKSTFNEAVRKTKLTLSSMTDEDIDNNPILSDGQKAKLRELTQHKRELADKNNVANTRDNIINGFRGSKNSKSHLGLRDYETIFTEAIATDDVDTVNQHLAYLARFRDNHVSKANLINETIAQPNRTADITIAAEANTGEWMVINKSDYTPEQLEAARTFDVPVRHNKGTKAINEEVQLIDQALTVWSGASRALMSGVQPIEAPRGVVESQSSPTSTGMPPNTYAPTGAPVTPTSTGQPSSTTPVTTSQTTPTSNTPTVTANIPVNNISNALGQPTANLSGLSDIQTGGVSIPEQLSVTQQEFKSQLMQDPQEAVRLANDMITGTPIPSLSNYSPQDSIDIATALTSIAVDNELVTTSQVRQEVNQVRAENVAKAMQTSDKHMTQLRDTATGTINIPEQLTPMETEWKEKLGKDLSKAEVLALDLKEGVVIPEFANLTHPEKRAAAVALVSIATENDFYASNAKGRALSESNISDVFSKYESPRGDNVVSTTERQWANTFENQPKMYQRIVQSEDTAVAIKEFSPRISQSSLETVVNLVESTSKRFDATTTENRVPQGIPGIRPEDLSSQRQGGEATKFQTPQGVVEVKPEVQAPKAIGLDGKELEGVQILATGDTSIQMDSGSIHKALEVSPTLSSTNRQTTTESPELAELETKWVNTFLENPKSLETLVTQIEKDVPLSSKFIDATEVERLAIARAADSVIADTTSTPEKSFEVTTPVTPQTVKEGLESVPVESMDRFESRWVNFFKKQPEKLVELAQSENFETTIHEMLPGYDNEEVERVSQLAESLVQQVAQPVTNAVTGISIADATKIKASDTKPNERVFKTAKNIDEVPKDAVYVSRHKDADGNWFSMGNTEPGEPGWLANANNVEKGKRKTKEGRREMLGAYVSDFKDSMTTKEGFAEAVVDLKGKDVYGYMYAPKESEASFVVDLLKVLPSDVEQAKQLVSRIESYDANEGFTLVAKGQESSTTKSRELLDKDFGIDMSTRNTKVSDEKFESFKGYIDTQVEEIKQSGEEFALPTGGMALDLREDAPKSYDYLNQKLKDEFGLDNEAEIKQNGVPFAPVSAAPGESTSVKQRSAIEAFGKVDTSIATPAPIRTRKARDELSEQSVQTTKEYTNEYVLTAGDGTERSIRIRRNREDNSVIDVINKAGNETIVTKADEVTPAMQKVMHSDDSLLRLMEGKYQSKSTSIQRNLNDSMQENEIELQLPDGTTETISEGELESPYVRVGKSLLPKELTASESLSPKDKPREAANLESALELYGDGIESDTVPEKERKLQLSVIKPMLAYNPGLKVIVENKDGESKYNKSKNTLYLKPPKKGSVLQEIARMVIHSSTENLVQELGEYESSNLDVKEDAHMASLVRNLNTVRNQIKKATRNSESKYDSLDSDTKSIITEMLGDNQKLINTGLSNPKVVKFLRSIEMNNKRGGKTSLYRRIVDSVKGFFNIGSNQEVHTQFDLLLDTTSRIVTEQARDKNVTFEKAEEARISVFRDYHESLAKAEFAKNFYSRNQLLAGFNQKGSKGKPLTTIPNLVSKLSADLMQGLSKFNSKVPTKAQRQQIEDFLGFHEEIREHLLATYAKKNQAKNDEGEVVTDFGYQDFKSFLSDEAGNIDENTLSAVSLALYDWSIEFGNKEKASDKDIKKFLNIDPDEDANITPEIYEQYKHFTGLKSYSVASLGQHIVQSLGLQTNENASPEAMSKLESSLGEWAISALQTADLMHISTMPTNQHFANIEFAGGKTTDRRGNELLEFSEASKEGSGQVSFIGVVDTNGKNYNPRLAEITRASKKTHGYMGEVFGNEVGLKRPTLEKPKDVIMDILRSSAKLSTAQAEHIKIMQEEPIAINVPMFEVLNKILEVDRNSALKMLGAHVSKEDLAKLHKMDRSGKEASTQGNLRDLENAIDFTHSLQKTKSSDSGYQLEHFYDTSHGAKNNRMHYDAAAFNFQSSKVHRAMGEYANFIAEVDLKGVDNNGNFELYDEDGKPTPLTLFFRAIAENAEGTEGVIEEALKDTEYEKGFTVDKVSSEEFVPAFVNYLRTDSKVLTAVASMQKMLDDPKTFSKADLENVNELVNEWDMGTNSLRALVEYTQFVTALENGTPLTTSLGLGSDGINNGTALSQVMFGTADDKFLTQVGFLLKDGNFSGLNDYFDSRKIPGIGDYYEGLVPFVKNVMGDLRESDPKLYAEMEEFLAINNNFFERKAMKNILIPFGYSAGLDRIRSLSFGQFLSDLKGQLEDLAHADTSTNENIADYNHDHHWLQQSLSELTGTEVKLPHGKDLLEFWLDQSQVISLKNMYADTLGKVMEDSLAEYAKDFIRERDFNVAIQGSAYDAYEIMHDSILERGTKQYKEFLKTQETYKDVDTKKLTLDEWLDRLIATEGIPKQYYDKFIGDELKSVLPTLRTPYNANEQQLDMFTSSDFVLAQESSNLKADQFLSADNRRVDAEGKLRATKNQLQVRKKTVDDVGLSGNSNQVQGLDAFIAGHASALGGKVNINVHDAAISGILNYIEMGQMQNMATYRGLRDYHAQTFSFLALSETLQKLVDYYAEGTVSDAQLLNNITRTLDRIIGFEAMAELEEEFGYNRKDVTPEVYYNKVVEPTLQIILDKISDTEKRKFTLLRRIDKVQQYGGEGSQHKVTDADIKLIDTQEGRVKEVHKNARNNLKGISDAFKKLDIDSDVKPGNKPSKVKGFLSVDKLTNYSGGAYGADTFFDIVGRQFGVNNHVHIRPEGSTNLSKPLRDFKDAEGNPSIKPLVISKKELASTLKEVETALGRKLKPGRGRDMQLRNYFQVKNADSVFAVAQLHGNRKRVDGGTNTAVTLSVKQGKPTYVWDINTEKWFAYNPNTKVFEEFDGVPKLTTNFAGIGSRDIQRYSVPHPDTKPNDPNPVFIEREATLPDEKGSAAMKAIADVYANTLGVDNTPETVMEDRIPDVPKVAVQNFTRESVENDTSTLYIFTDNLFRTSGREDNIIPESSPYYTTFVKPYLQEGETSVNNYPFTTQAQVRGLSNAMPVSTKVSVENQFKDTDESFESFKQTVDMEIEYIVQAVSQGAFTSIKYSAEGYMGNNGGKAALPQRHFEYLTQKLREIGIDNYTALGVNTRFKPLPPESSVPSNNQEDTSVSTSKQVSDNPLQQNENDVSTTVKGLLAKVKDSDSHVVKASLKRIRRAVDTLKENNVGFTVEQVSKKGDMSASFSIRPYTSDKTLSGVTRTVRIYAPKSEPAERLLDRIANGLVNAAATPIEQEYVGGIPTEVVSEIIEQFNDLQSLGDQVQSEDLVSEIYYLNGSLASSNTTVNLDLSATGNKQSYKVTKNGYGNPHVDIKIPGFYKMDAENKIRSLVGVLTATVEEVAPYINEIDTRIFLPVTLASIDSEVSNKELNESLKDEAKKIDSAMQSLVKDFSTVKSIKILKRDIRGKTTEAGELVPEGVFYGFNGEISIVVPGGLDIEERMDLVAELTGRARGILTSLTESGLSEDAVIRNTSQYLNIANIVNTPENLVDKDTATKILDGVSKLIHQGVSLSDRYTSGKPVNGLSDDKKFFFYDSTQSDTDGFIRELQDAVNVAVNSLVQQPGDGKFTQEGEEFTFKSLYEKLGAKEDTGSLKNARLAMIDFFNKNLLSTENKRVFQPKIVATNDLKPGQEGYYDAKTHTVHISRGILNSDNMDKINEVVLHEMVHAYSARVATLVEVYLGTKNKNDIPAELREDFENLDKGTIDSYKKLEKMRKHLLAKLDKIDTSNDPKLKARADFLRDNVLSDFNEFIAYGLTRESVQADIADMLADSFHKNDLKKESFESTKSSRLKNFFGKFVEEVFSFLSGRLKGSSRTKAELDDAYKSFARLADDLINVPTKEDVDLFNAVFKDKEIILNSFEDPVASLGGSPKQILGNLSTTGVSQEHNKQLNEVFDAVENYHNRGVNQENQTIRVLSNVGNDAILAGYRMTDKEVYAYEIVRSIGETFLKESAGEKAALTYMDMFKKITDESIFTDDVFLSDPANATPAERAEARRKRLFITRQDSKNQEEQFERFLAMSVASEEFRKVIDNIDTSQLDTEQDETWFDRAMGTYSNMVDWLGDKTLGISGMSNSDSLSGLFLKLTEINQSAAAYQSGTLDKAYDAVLSPVATSANFVGDKLFNGLFTAFGGAAKLTGNPTLKVLAETTENTRKAGIDTVANTYLGNQALHSKQGGMAGRLNEMGELISEFTAYTGMKKTVEGLIRMTNKEGQERQVRKQAATSKLAELFKDYDNTPPEQLESLTRVGLKTDVGSLMNHGKNVNDTIRMMIDDNARNSEIKKLEKYVMENHTEYNDMLIQSKALAIRMGREENPEHLALNADNIAIGLGSWYQIERSEMDTELRDAIDQLVSLYAIGHTSSEQRDHMRALVSADREAVKGALKYSQQLAESSKRGFDDNPYNYIKGYLPEQTNHYRSLMFALDSDDIEKMEAEGWEILYDKDLGQDETDTTDTRTLMFHRDIAYQDYVSGALDMKDTHSKGTVVYDRTTYDDLERVTRAKLRRRRERNRTSFRDYKGEYDTDSNLVANYDSDGYVLNYRYEMSGKLRDQYLERNNNAVDILSIHESDLHFKPRIAEAQRNVATALYEDYMENYTDNPEEFVILDPESTDPEVVKMWRMMPYAFQEQATELFGKDQPIVVRSKVFTPVFGFKKYGIGEIFEKGAENRNPIEKLIHWLFTSIFDEKAQTMATKVDRFYKSSVKEIKDWIVIRNAEILIGNVVANGSILAMHGVNPMQQFKDFVFVWRNGGKYRKQALEIAEIDVALSINRGKPAELRKLNRRRNLLMTELGKNPMHPYMQAGLMSTIVEDTNFGEEQTRYKSDFEVEVDKYLEYIPGQIRTAFEWATMGKSTPMHKFMGHSTQFSDLAAKYSLANKLMKKDNVSFEDAITEAQGVFINYDVPSGRGMDAMNSYGLFMFTKFFVRFQHALNNLLEKKAGAAIGQHMALEHYTDFPGVLQPLAINNLGNPLHPGILKGGDAFADISTVSFGRAVVGF